MSSLVESPKWNIIVTYNVVTGAHDGYCSGPSNYQEISEREEKKIYPLYRGILDVDEDIDVDKSIYDDSLHKLESNYDIKSTSMWGCGCGDNYYIIAAQLVKKSDEVKDEDL